MKLRLSNFKEVPLDWKLFYYSYELPSGNEICLEHCAGGFCVGLYDEHKNLIGKKECTNIHKYKPTFEGRYTSEKTFAVNKALDIATKLLESMNQKLNL